MTFLCGLDFLVRFAISSKPKGFFAKPPNVWLLDTEAVKRGEGEKGVWSFISPILSIFQISGSNSFASHTSFFQKKKVVSTSFNL
jgi:hypothetical protein